MKIQTYLYTESLWDKNLDGSLDSSDTLVIVFGTIHIEKVSDALSSIYDTYPNSTIIGCSSGGEIYDAEIYDESLSVSVLRFQKGEFRVVYKKVDEDQSFEIGKEIADELSEDELKGVFIISNVLGVNGSEIMKGMNKTLPKGAKVIGGLAGDGVDFGKTWIINGRKIVNDYICVVGFYGKDLHIKHSCRCGWRKFGIDRKVTHAYDNILYTLDNKPALQLYKRYLGEHASQLPASALYFPLMLQNEDKSESKFRAIKAIDEENDSIILAGNIEQNSLVSFAVASLDDLISSSQEAVNELVAEFDEQTEALCVCVGCVARRFVLKQQAEDELEVIKDALGENIGMVGFYSFGEFSRSESGCCDFCNQTMALSLIYES